MPDKKQPGTKQPNVLPDWWAFTFMALQVFSLGPMVYNSLTNPVGAFKKLIPAGYDPATDIITSSLRLRMTEGNNAQSYLMIAGLFIGCTLFARNSLRGQPKLQQSLVKLPIFAGLFSDIWLYVTMATMLPPDMRYNPAKWTPAIKGLVFGLPGATTLKLLYLFGIGRDVV